MTVDLAADEEVTRRQVAVYNAERGEVLHATGGALAKGQQLIVAQKELGKGQVSKERGQLRSNLSVHTHTSDVHTSQQEHRYGTFAMRNFLSEPPATNSVTMPHSLPGACVRTTCGISTQNCITKTTR